MSGIFSGVSKSLWTYRSTINSAVLVNALYLRYNGVMPLKFYNTLSKKLEDFEPQNPPTVNLYTCGPTVYNFAHIGNLRYFIFSDVLRRVLTANGYKVDHVMNITDVGHLSSDQDEGEDKLEKGAAREGKTVWDVAKLYTGAFLQDIDRLNVKRAATIAPATEYIQKQIEMIKLLEEKGFTYKTDQAVYFDTSKLPDYGKLSGQKLEEKQTSREEIVQDPAKLRQHDFALWFFRVGRYQDHAMHWDSPWGEGFPGWHIECSAINWQFFPNGTDIHTGGIDHIPVHHTNEIAQYEAALERPMSKYWVHGNFLVLKDSVKMAKSGENFLTLQSLIDKGIDPLAYRYFVLQAHYRSELQFSWEALEAAQNALRSLQNTIRNWDAPKVGCAGYEQDFLAAINEDLNTPKALRIMWDVVKSDYPSGARAQSILWMDAVLGLRLNDYVSKPLTVPADVAKLVKEREQARLAKDFTKSDKLRIEIAARGYSIEDTPTGPKLSTI